MQENWQQLSQFFSTEQRYVLATIVNTKGATYRKIGTMMLIEESGQCCGLLSGGCLEADITLHAQQVFADNKSKLLNYDLKADAELLWGLGLGCDGALDILLQPLNKQNDFLDFRSLLDAITKKNTGYYHLVINDNALAEGWFIESSLALSSDNKNVVDAEFPTNIHLIQCELIIPVVPTPSVVICGAGPDAVPVVQLINQMGWQVSLWDHRVGHLEQAEFECCYDKQTLKGENVQLEHFSKVDAVVIMSHNLSNDSLFLQSAINANVSYIGLLGPVGRRDKMLKELDLTIEALQGQVYGPVGLDIGGRSPQGIALSITAEIQQHTSKKNSELSLCAWRQSR